MPTLHEIASAYTGGSLRNVLLAASGNVREGLTEIRVRLDKPLIIHTLDGENFIAPDGGFCNPECAYKPVRRDIDVMMEMLGDYSLYALQEEIINGFITVPGGHRVGVSGQCVSEGGRIKTIKYVSSLCFRVAAQIIGCAAPIMDYIRGPDGAVLHTLIISPPGCGKTTLLRDTVRLLSLSGLTVGVADERGEISGSHMGKAANDLGPRTDVLDSCPKALGMAMMLRSMCPDVIAADEIGRPEEQDAIEDAINSGVSLICTAHSPDICCAAERPLLKTLIERKAFNRFIVLGGARPGNVTGVYDENRNKIKTLGALPPNPRKGASPLDPIVKNQQI